jgi:hypothetical protein
MKRLIMLIAGLALLTSTVFSQNIECVSCSNNVIDFTKYASGVGGENTATGLKAFVAGSNSQALGDYSVAMGYGCNATENYSFAFGKNTLASQVYAFSLGKYSESTSAAAFSLGTYLKASDQYSMVIGKGFGFSFPLENNIQNSLMVGFDSNLPTLFVGPAVGTGKTGKIGIGNVSDPQAKLHIRADTADDATLRLEPVIGSSKVSRIYFSNTNDYYIQAANNQNMVFKTLTGNNYEFKNGNIGLDTDNPVAKLQVKNGDIFIEDIDRGIIMKSPDGNCWRGTLDNTGSLHFVQVNCDDLLTGQNEPQSNIKPHFKIYPNPAGDKIFVSIDPQLTGARLEITDVGGKLLDAEILVNSDNYIELSGYKSGMYVLIIIDKTGKIVFSEKIIKQKL